MKSSEFFHLYPETVVKARTCE